MARDAAFEDIFLWKKKKEKKILTNKEMISLQSFVEYNADIKIKELIVEEELTLLIPRIQILLHNSGVLYRTAIYLLRLAELAL